MQSLRRFWLLPRPPVSAATVISAPTTSAVALTAEDAKAAADVVGADMPVAADTGDVTISKTEVVIAPQAHTPSGLTNALTKMLLTA